MHNFALDNQPCDKQAADNGEREEKTEVSATRVQDEEMMSTQRKQNDCGTVCVTESSSAHTHQLLQVQISPFWQRAAPLSHLPEGELDQ